MGRVAVVLAVLLVLVVGLIVVTRRAGPAAPSASAGASEQAQVPSPAVASPSVVASAGASDVASPSSSADASASPSGAAAQATFTVSIGLDASDDPAGQARVITFTSDAPGTVTVNLKTTTPPGATHMCLSQGSKEVGCKDWTHGTFTRTTSQANVRWMVTVIGVGAATPVVQVGATFSATSPTVVIQGARFDGNAFPNTNGLFVGFAARAPGSVHIVASWGGHPFMYQLSLVDESSGTGADKVPEQGPSTGVDATLPIATAGDWQVGLQNAEAGFGPTEMTASVSWP